MYQDPSVEFIPETLTSNLKAEFTVFINQAVADTRRSEPPPPPSIILKDCKNLSPNNTNHTQIM
jgi:hypothetical protein